jgi:hypothetical protein
MTSLLLNFTLNFLVALLLVRFIYYPVTRNKSFVLTFLAFNTVIYFVISFMTTFEIGIGVGFGLFAIFSILRYRTETMPIREMTYLFVTSALPVMNAAALNADIWLELTAANLIILALMYALEKGWGFRYEHTQEITYEKIELIPPQRRAELLADLQTRTGLPIRRVDVTRIDFLRDVAVLQVYF